jgi:hypothetical protein
MAFLVACVLPLAITLLLIKLASQSLRRLPIYGFGGQQPFSLARLQRLRAPFDVESTAGQSSHDEAAPVLARLALLGRQMVTQSRENVWILLAAFAVCTYLVTRLAPAGGRYFGAVLLPVWLIAVLVTIPFAVTNPFFTRRPGFFDHLLQTPLEPHEILRESILVNRPAMAYVFAAPCILTLLLLATNPIGLLLAFCIGSFIAAAVLTLGNLCSLVDHRLVYRTVPTLGFLVVLLVGPQWAAPCVGAAPALKLFFGAIAFWLVASWWTRYRATAPSVSCHFLAIYLVFVSAVVSLPAQWLGIGDPQLTPLEVVNPVFWLTALLWHVVPADRGTSIRLLAPGYVIACALHLSLVWCWTLRFFDHLVGRTTVDGPGRQRPKLQAPRRSR